MKASNVYPFGPRVPVGNAIVRHHFVERASNGAYSALRPRSANDDVAEAPSVWERVPHDRVCWPLAGVCIVALIVLLVAMSTLGVQLAP